MRGNVGWIEMLTSSHDGALLLEIYIKLFIEIPGIFLHSCCVGHVVWKKVLKD